MRSDCWPLGRWRKASSGVLLPPRGASWNTSRDVHSSFPGLPCPSSGPGRRTTFLLTRLSLHPRALCSVPRATPTSRTVGAKMALRSKVSPIPGTGRQKWKVHWTGCYHGYFYPALRMQPACHLFRKQDYDPPIRSHPTAPAPLCLPLQPICSVSPGSSPHRASGYTWK